ncbi:MAG: hypothetical protein GY716_17370 [bacterium]|nr:hypothetical protein [bacterium]
MQTKVLIVGGTLAALLVALVLFSLTAGRRIAGQDARPVPGASFASAEVERHPPSADQRGFLYGRVTVDDGGTHEGRLRWGGGEEAFWGDYFNGTKEENPWGAHVPAEQLVQRKPVTVLGVQVSEREKSVPLRRPFMVRFGDIARIETPDGGLRVILKSGTAFDLDRMGADDLADGLRVWDRDTGSVMDLPERRIRSVEFLPGAAQGDAPYRLHGTVRTQHGEFTGFVQWDRREGVGSDTLEGRSDEEGTIGIPYETMRSIERRSRDSVLVTLLDGREVVLSDRREVSRDNRGIYVDDVRYGRVLIRWDSFERFDLAPAGSGPGYDDYPTGRPLTGSVTTRAGDVLTGRLVFDLDESETSDTLDAPLAGVNYTILFGLVASIVLPDLDGRPATVTLHGGEELRLERAGDLAVQNGGTLIFVDDGPRADYVSWNDVERIDFERPAAMYPPHGESPPAPR